MTRTIGLATSSRSERHLMEPIYHTMKLNYDLKVELIDLRVEPITKDYQWKWLEAMSFLIIPSDRTEMCRFAYDCFIKNIPFCHMFSGSITYSYTHDDINRFLIALMANMCFAESPMAVKNLKRVGIPEDRILLSGCTHFDNIEFNDIISNKPKDAPKQPYDLILYNPTTSKEENINPLDYVKSKHYVWVGANEDASYRKGKEYPHLEFLWLLYHADNFISNSSAGIYELPYLQLYGSRCQLVNPSMRNKTRTPIPPQYLKGTSKIIAEFSENVDLEWLKTPKRLFYKEDESLIGLPK